MTLCYSLVRVCVVATYVQFFFVTCILCRRATDQIYSVMRRITSILLPCTGSVLFCHAQDQFHSVMHRISSILSCTGSVPFCHHAQNQFHSGTGIRSKVSCQFGRSTYLMCHLVLYDLFASTNKKIVINA